MVIRLSGHDLGCVRGGREVFEGINFTVGGGEVLVLTGPNGAGKTTLLRLIAGLLEPAQGCLELTGGAAEASLPEQAHYLGHRDAVKPALSVEENLQFWGAFLGDGGASGANAASALAAVGLATLAGLPAAYLSAGQRRRLTVARLIVAPRPIWLLDEPTAALDAASQDRLADLMRAHLAAGGLIVAATHGPLGLDNVKELRLGNAASPHALSTPSPRVGEGRGGGQTLGDAIHPHTTPTGLREEASASQAPDPFPQGGGEKKPPQGGGERELP